MSAIDSASSAGVEGTWLTVLLSTHPTPSNRWPPHCNWAPPVFSPASPASSTCNRIQACLPSASLHTTVLGHCPFVALDLKVPPGPRPACPPAASTKYCSRVLHGATATGAWPAGAAPLLREPCAPDGHARVPLNAKQHILCDCEYGSAEATVCTSMSLILGAWDMCRIGHREPLLREY